MTTTQTVTTVTVPEGITRRQYEQTASRDHSVTLVPGTYAVKTKRSAEGCLRWYAAAVPAVTAAGGTEHYSLQVREYEVDAYTGQGYVFA